MGWGVGGVGIVTLHFQRGGLSWNSNLLLDPFSSNQTDISTSSPHSLWYLDF